MADEQLDILFTAPHPDDLEIGCGGAIAALAQRGYRVGMVHMTDGEPTPRGDSQTRRGEAAAAAQTLGATVMEILPLTNRELMDAPQARYILASVVRKYRPRILVGIAGRTPAASPDHYQAQLLTEAVRFCSQLTKWNERFDGTEPHRVDHLLYRSIPSSAEVPHWPSQIVMDISGTIEQKLAAVACYKSQFDGPRLERLQHYIRSTAGFEGAACGFRYGELYAVPRPVGTPDIVSLFGKWEIPPPFDGLQR